LLLVLRPIGFYCSRADRTGRVVHTDIDREQARFIGLAQDDIFDAVLIQQGHTSLVSRGRQITRSGGQKGFVKLGKSVIAPFNWFNKERIARYLISLPLNAVPFIGTVLFLLYNGLKTGPVFHARYFQLKGLSKSAREQFVQRHKGVYTGFGAMTLALNLIPVAGLVFGFTSIAGAALWASDLEKKEPSGPVPQEQEECVEL